MSTFTVDPKRFHILKENVGVFLSFVYLMLNMYSTLEFDSGFEMSFWPEAGL